MEIAHINRAAQTGEPVLLWNLKYSNCDELDLWESLFIELRESEGNLDAPSEIPAGSTKRFEYKNEDEDESFVDTTTSKREYEYPSLF